MLLLLLAGGSGDDGRARVAKYTSRRPICGRYGLSLPLIHEYPSRADRWPLVEFLRGYRRRRDRGVGPLSSTHLPSPAASPVHSAASRSLKNFLWTEEEAPGKVWEEEGGYGIG